jgi:hypothetical protein
MRTRSSLALKLPMRQEFTASLAIKSTNGMGFGTAYWMQGDRIAFTTEMELEQDDLIEVRMDLTGFNDSAMGNILVIQTRMEDNGLLTCLGQIVEMPKEDFEMLNQWLDDLIAGNTASQSSRWLRSITNSRGPQADQDQTAAALKRIDKRMGNDSRSPSIAPVSKENSSGPDSSIRRKIGRQAIRAALRASVQAGAAAEAAAPQPSLKVVEPKPAPVPEVQSHQEAVPKNEAPSIPVPTIPVPSIPAPSIPAPSIPAPSIPAPSIPAVTEPTLSQSAPTAHADTDNALQVGIRVKRSPDGTVDLSWANTQSLIHTWKQGLKTGKLTLPPFENAPEAGEQIRFNFTLPDGETFALRGSVSQSDDSGVECKIRIPWGTRIKLLRIQEKT